jgi:hypothetical protein
MTAFSFSTMFCSPAMLVVCWVCRVFKEDGALGWLYETNSIAEKLLPARLRVGDECPYMWDHSNIPGRGSVMPQP